MRFPRSIRWRLQLWHGALLAAVLLGFGLTGYHLERARQWRRIDEGLQARIAVLVEALRVAPERGQERRRNPELRLSEAHAALFGDEPGHYYAIWMQGKEPVLSSANAPRDLPRPGKGEAVVRMRGQWREAFLFAAPVDCVLVGRSIGAEQADLARWAALLAAVGAGVFAGALVVGGWLVGRALRPIEEISQAAARIGEGDLSRRIDAGEAASELARLVAVLNTSFARLEAAFAQQGRFTADAAHELRTPVAVILAQTQSVLARERPASEYRESLEACERAAQRMRALVDSLLELARLDAGQEPLRLEPSDLAALAEEALAFVRPLAAARQIVLESELAPAPCRGDAERLGRVLASLLSNAIEYNVHGGRVRVCTGLEGERAVLRVSNTGPGISPEGRARLFERFYRADQARTGGGHSGLGLAIAQAIVRAHGGELGLEVGAGEWTTFAVRLPEGAQARI